MILIYGKGKVGNAVAGLCDFLKISHEIKDDNDQVDFSQYDFIVPSPGVPSTHNVYKTGKVKSELDFAFTYLPQAFHIVAVTGTDGKSTTSWILYELLKQEYGEEKVYLSGNFEIPFSETVRMILEKGQKRGYIVLEVSSFMSYTLEKFQSEYSIFTNFKADHLNWHKDLQDYFESKMNLMRRTKKTAVINEQILQFAMDYRFVVPSLKYLRKFVFQESNKSGYKDWTDGENITLSGRKKYKLSDSNFSGVHNALNILSATIVTNEMGICSKRTKEYLKKIHGLPHRLEKIGEKNGIIFVEDSKSTSSQSLEAALSSYGKEDNKNLLIIVGGSDKGDTFDHLSEKMKKRVKMMACIGATKDRFLSIAQKMNIQSLSTDSLEEATLWLYKSGSRGDVLMLSPGCASFGLFRDYLDRATQFRESIKKLP